MSVIIIFSIIAISTNYWMYGSNLDFEENIGLWNTCSSISSDTNETCEKTSDLNKIKNLIAIQFFSVSSLLLMIASLFLMHFFPNKLYSVICIGLSGIFALISCILWKTDPSMKDKDPNAKTGYSFYLEIFSGLLAITLSILLQYNVLDTVDFSAFFSSK